VIEGVLTTDEVDELNAAIDHHVPLLNAQPSNAMGGRTPGMIGDRNVHSLIAAHLNEQRGTELGPVDIMDMLLEAGYPAQGRSVSFGQALSQAERQEIIAEMKSRQSEEVFAGALSKMAPPGGVPLSEDEKAAILELLSTWRTENDEGSVVRMGTTRTDLNGMLSKWRHDMLPSGLLHSSQDGSDIVVDRLGRTLLDSVPQAAGAPAGEALLGGDLRQGLPHGPHAACLDRAQGGGRPEPPRRRGAALRPGRIPRRLCAATRVLIRYPPLRVRCSQTSTTPATCTLG
jgi:hypothetical protein